MLMGVAGPIVGSVLVGRWVWGVLSVTTDPLRRGAPIGVADALLACTAALALATLAWLALGMVLETVARAPGQIGRVAARASAAVSPLIVRRAAAVALGASLSATFSPGVSMAATGATLATSFGVSSSPTPGAPAASSQPDPASSAPEPGFAPLPDPGFAPPRGPGFAPPPSDQRFVAEPPAVRPQPDVSVLANGDRRAADAGTSPEVVVHRGDSLWSIAARHLGHEPSDAEIAREWPRWYAANRAVIGSDPDLLHPGQVLAAPGGSRR